MIKQDPFDPFVGFKQVLPLRFRVDLEVMAVKGYFLHSPKLKDKNLTIRLFSVIPGIFVGGGVLPLCRGAVGIFYITSKLGGKEF